MIKWGIIGLGNMGQKVASAIKETSNSKIISIASLDKNKIKNFKDNDKVRFFVGTPATGGYGITLTQANTVIYYSNGYDLEKRMQSEDRAHRIGQTKKVTYIDLIAEDTVDTKIVKSLRKKIDIASKVMGEELKAWI